MMDLHKPKGTEDLFGKSMRAWTNMQRIAAKIFDRYGFDLIETPTMEQLDVFTHGIGTSTDVVRKEMFRVFSGANLTRVLEEGSDEGLKAAQRLALRPEGTAGFARAAIENTFVPQGGAPCKMYYAGPMFRGEDVQKGRLREFHQIGVEVLGAEEPALDAEVIIMLMQFFGELGLSKNDMVLKINSMGDATCRPSYRDKVAAFIKTYESDMCPECKKRADTNPLRAFDCKNPHCREIMQGAPLISDMLCDECAAHYAAVKRYLDEANIAYVEDPTLVRGLDYYGRTVFEVEATSGVGAQSAIGGGGRYDGLMELVGGKPTPGIGFAVGFERIMLSLDAIGIDLAGPAPSCIYVAKTSESLRDEVFNLCLALRKEGFRTEADYQNRSLKSQFKQADKLNAIACLVLGEDEVASHTVTVRNMQTHEQTSVAVKDVADYLKSVQQETH